MKLDMTPRCTRPCYCREEPLQAGVETPVARGRPARRFDRSTPLWSVREQSADFWLCARRSRCRDLALHHPKKRSRAVAGAAVHLRGA
ncbi:conserved hypothetical protein [Ricinus communis]|uniref:Uncharacterized protein n=1 Tax=Ricinus communis TaxID=3988 RepID=B9THS2_RICCO|nr:conserved hypothetical protein [Ricinus communis]